MTASNRRTAKTAAPDRPRSETRPSRPARPGKKPPWRPTTLTPETARKIIQRVLEGNYFSVACRASGVPVDTGAEWLRRGRGDDSRRPKQEPYASFARAIEEAEAEVEALAIKDVLAEGPPGKKWWLERKAKERWLKPEKVQLENPDGSALLGKDTTDAILRLVAGGAAT